MQRFAVRSQSGNVTGILAAALIVASAIGGRPPSFHGTAYEPPEAAPAGELR